MASPLVAGCGPTFDRWKLSGVSDWRLAEPRADPLCCPLTGPGHGTCPWGKEVLEVDLPWLDGIVRAKRPARLPVVLTRAEVRGVLQRLDGVPHLMACLLYGAGLRVLECCRPRVQDIDFATNQIVVRGGKGDKEGAAGARRREHHHDLHPRSESRAGRGEEPGGPDVRPMTTPAASAGIRTGIRCTTAQPISTR